MTKKIMWAMLLGSLISFANLYGPQAFIQHFAHDFQLNASQASLALSISTFTLAFSMLIVAAISNKIGRTKIMTYSLIGSSILYILVGFAPNYTVLLIIRALQGILIAGFPAIAVTYLAEELSKKDFAKVLGIYITGSGVGGFFGRIVSSTMVDVANWHVAVWTLGTMTLLLSFIFAALIVPSKNFITQPLSLKSWLNSLSDACKDTQLWCLYGLGFLALGVYVAVFNYVAFPLMTQYGLSQTLIGFIFVFQLIGSIGSMIVNKLEIHFSRLHLLSGSLIVSCIGICLTLMPSLFTMLIGLCIISCAFFAWHSLASGAVSRTASPNAKAYASSLYLLFYYVGSSVVGTIGGHFYDTNAWHGMGVLLLICIVCAFTFVGSLKYQQSKKNVPAVKHSS